MRHSGSSNANPEAPLWLSGRLQNPTPDGRAELCVQTSPESHSESLPTLHIRLQPNELHSHASESYEPAALAVPQQS
jgi:hypothetical protein